MSVTAELQFTRVGTNSVVEESLLFFSFFYVKNLTATHAPLKVLIFASWKILKNLVLNTEVTRK